MTRVLVQNRTESKKVRRILRRFSLRYVNRKTIVLVFTDIKYKLGIEHGLVDKPL